MALSNRQRDGEGERELLERLKSSYEQRGFTFVSRPKSSAMPAFLTGYVPDALATKGDEKVMIEVKSRQGADTERRLAELKQRIAGHEHWKLSVVYAPGREEDAVLIALPKAEALYRKMDETRELCESGHGSVAFVLAWSLLEAALNYRKKPAGVGQLRSPGQLVQSLAIDGYINEGLEKNLRRLAALRNRIVHGDLQASASKAEIETVLEAVSNTLAT